MITPGLKERRTVLFIAGLTHSGSTLLDILLGRTNILVGLGEVVPLLRAGNTKLQETDRLCSCGEPISACPFWSLVAKEQRLHPDASVETMYISLLEIFFEIFGAERIPVDSSKSLGSLQAVSSIPDLDLKVIHLLRDVRGWVVSRKDVDARKRNKVHKGSGDHKESFWRDNVFSRFLTWYYGNKRIIEFTNDKQLMRVTLGYENLVFETDYAISTTLSRLRIEDNLLSERGERSSSHIVLGNRMRLSKVNDRITYDRRWFTRTEWRIPALLFWRVMQFNKQWVYEIADNCGYASNAKSNVADVGCRSSTGPTR